MAPTTTPTPTLELRDEAPDRPVLRLAGVDYHFALKSDLSMVDLAQSQAIGEAMQQLGSSPTPEQLEVVSRQLRDVVELATHDMPRDVIDTLTDGECIAVVEAFMTTLPAQASPVASSPTPQPSSPGTSTSTPNAS